jgi:hypothetical protein
LGAAVAEWLRASDGGLIWFAVVFD